MMLLDTYTNINNTAFTKSIAAENYMDRFYIAFDNTQNTLSIDTFSSVENTMKVSYYNSSNSLNFNTNTAELIEEIHIYDYTGKQLLSIKNINKRKIDVTAISNIKSVIAHIIIESETILKQIVLRS